MAQGENLPGAAKRRELLAQGSSELGAAGRALLAAGRWGEALECLTAAGDAQALGELAVKAEEAGDYFFWKGALKALGRKAPDEDGGKILQKAAEIGKPSFAQQAK